MFALASPFGSFGAQWFQSFKEELCSPTQLPVSVNTACSLLGFSMGLSPLMLWAVSAQLGDSRRETGAFTGNKKRLSHIQLRDVNPGISHEHTGAGPAVCWKDGTHQAPERWLSSPWVRFVMLPRGCRSISILPAYHESSPSALLHQP